MTPWNAINLLNPLGGFNCLTGLPSAPAQNDSTPVGSIISYGGDWTTNKLSLQQQGWLLCDGSAVAHAHYPQLFCAIGTLYTANPDDPVTSFNLPDYQGYFLRGVDPNGQVDPDQHLRKASGSGEASGVGSIQAHAIIDHSHHYNQPNQDGPGGEVSKADLLTMAQQETVDTIVDDQGDYVSSKETRPINIYVFFLIKAFQAPTTVPSLGLLSNPMPFLSQER